VTREQEILSFQITTKAPEETEMDRVHRLLPTGSERFMVHKVDRLACGYAPSSNVLTLCS
jgi:hypothetical protein